MKKAAVVLMTFLLAIAVASTACAASKINRDGYYKGIKLCGKVKVVESFPDIKVQVVDSFPDLKVQLVDSFPDKVGKWQFVDSFPDTGQGSARRHHRIHYEQRHDGQGEPECPKVYRPAC